MKLPKYRMSTGLDMMTGERTIFVIVQPESNSFSNKKSIDAVRKRMIDLKMPRTHIQLDALGDVRIP
jgi:hypothetical protein